MAFYITTPAGKVSLDKLECYARKRLEFLCKVAACRGSVMSMKDVMEVAAADSDCLIEGSRKDRISHFTLRLACCSDSMMHEFFTSAEIELFSHRLSCMSEMELLQAVKPLRKLKQMIQGQSCWYITQMSCTMRYILQKIDYLTYDFDWKSLISNYIGGKSKAFIIMPFQHCLPLVAKREVTINSGYAYVPCSKLSVLLMDLFKDLLEYGMILAEQKYPILIQDARMQKLFAVLKKIFHQHHRLADQMCYLQQVRSEDVDELSEFFPLCMHHLHQTLRKRHRLTHHSRIQYTLFLKEVGMPVHEAFHFWKSEYQQPSFLDSTCTHHWQRDRRRYLYSIRHLYGLEGSRKNYRGHCCKSLQNQDPGPMGEGGCPFKHFSEENFVACLSGHSLSEAVTSEIKDLAASGAFHTACTLHLIAKAQLANNRLQSQSMKGADKRNNEKHKEAEHARQADQRKQRKGSWWETNLKYDPKASQTRKKGEITVETTKIDDKIGENGNKGWIKVETRKISEETEETGNKGWIKAEIQKIGDETGENGNKDGIKVEIATIEDHLDTGIESDLEIQADKMLHFGVKMESLVSNTDGFLGEWNVSDHNRRESNWSSMNTILQHIDPLNTKEYADNKAGKRTICSGKANDNSTEGNNIVSNDGDKITVISADENIEAFDKKESNKVKLKEEFGKGEINKIKLMQEGYDYVHHDEKELGEKVFGKTGLGDEEVSVTQRQLLESGDSMDLFSGSSESNSLPDSDSEETGPYSQDLFSAPSSEDSEDELMDIEFGPTRKEVAPPYSMAWCSEFPVMDLCGKYGTQGHKVITEACYEHDDCASQNDFQHSIMTSSLRSRRQEIVRHYSDVIISKPVHYVESYKNMLECLRNLDRKKQT